MCPYTSVIHAWNNDRAPLQEKKEAQVHGGLGGWERNSALKRELHWAAGTNVYLSLCPVKNCVICLCYLFTGNK